MICNWFQYEELLIPCQRTPRTKFFGKNSTRTEINNVC